MLSVGSNQVEDTDIFFSLLESDHVNVKDDSIGRYAEQLLDHAQYHTGTILLVLSQPYRHTEKLCCLGEKQPGMKTKLDSG